MELKVLRVTQVAVAPLARSNYPGMSTKASRVCKAYSETVTGTRGVPGVHPGTHGALRVHPGRHGVPGEPSKLRSTNAFGDAWRAPSTSPGLDAWQAPSRAPGLDAWRLPGRVAFDHP